jgi:arylformamidase
MATETFSWQWLFLSYPMAAQSPAYGGGKGAVITPVNQIASGDSSNTGHWSFTNHLGTHLDLPRHFISNGPTIDDYDASFFVFEKAAVVDLGEVSPGEIISVRHVKRHEFPRDIDILIIKTGFCRKRRTAVFWQANPGFSPDLADYLREKFPTLRVLGFDSISLSSYSHRELGRDAHRRFLEGPRPLLPLEDMDLVQVTERTCFKRVIVAPWRVKGAEGVPCTVFGETDNRKISDGTY